MQEVHVQKVNVSEKRKCTSCVKFRVCSLVRAIAPLLKDFNVKPFMVEDLAVICREYVSVYLLPEA